jgi:hypothetical protein
MQMCSPPEAWPAASENGGKRSRGHADGGDGSCLRGSCHPAIVGIARLNSWPMACPAVSGSYSSGAGGLSSAIARSSSALKASLAITSTGHAGAEIGQGGLEVAAGRLKRLVEEVLCRRGHGVSALRTRPQPSRTPPPPRA